MLVSPLRSAQRTRNGRLRDLVAEDAVALGRDGAPFPPVAEPLPSQVDVGVALEVHRSQAPRHYRFHSVDGRGQPTTWSAHKPVDVWVDQSLAPANFAERVLQVLGEMTYFTGIPFRMSGIGHMTVGAFKKRIARHEDGPNVLVTYVATTAELESSTPAVANCSTWRHTASGVERITHGLIRCSQEAGPSGTDTPNGLNTVLRHEAGHLVGLGHVDNVHQVMATTGRQAISWGLGDETGLRLIGNAARLRCEGSSL